MKDEEKQEGDNCFLKGNKSKQ
jgi:hypothetical protein